MNEFQMRLKLLYGLLIYVVVFLFPLYSPSLVLFCDKNVPATSYVKSKNGLNASRERKDENERSTKVHWNV